MIPQPDHRSMPTRLTAYWTRNLVIVWVMLGLWLFVTIGVVWVAVDLSSMRWRNAHAYWLTAYGAPLCYLLLVGLYALLMRTKRH